MEVSTAGDWLRIGRALTQLDEIDNAFEQGRLSYSKVRALTRMATVATQSELCALAERVQARRCACALAGGRASGETRAETEARQHEARGAGWHTDVDGMGAGWFRFTPEDM